MHLLDWIILALVAVIFILALRSTMKRNRNGCCGGGGCSGCGGNCFACGSCSCRKHSAKKAAKKMNHEKLSE